MLPQSTKMFPFFKKESSKKKHCTAFQLATTSLLLSSVVLLSTNDSFEQWQLQPQFQPHVKAVGTTTTTTTTTSILATSLIQSYQQWYQHGVAALRMSDPDLDVEEDSEEEPPNVNSEEELFPNELSPNESLKEESPDEESPDEESSHHVDSSIGSQDSGRSQVLTESESLAVRGVPGKRTLFLNGELLIASGRFLDGELLNGRVISADGRIK
jgi:hypothetical protein